MAELEYRVEKDSMGEVRVPATAYWGAQTQRAVDNFPVSGRRMPAAFIRALGLIKKHAAIVNARMELVETRLADAIVEAASEVAAGRLDEHFPIDVFQTGSGTSSNMNANEVISNRANELLGSPLGSRSPVHPNDHVNRGQSSNDVVPAALHVMAMLQLTEDLLPGLGHLAQALAAKATEFAGVVKIGRTHLQDAVPLTLGQELGGYAQQVKNAISRIEAAMPRVAELALGGTAVGTGLNAPEGFAPMVIAGLAEETGIGFVQAPNLFEALAARDAAVELSGALNTFAASLMKIGNDLRLLASGPRTAVGEIVLPSLQPGSSIMPGKVNPVVPESVCQVAAEIMGNNVAITTGGASGLLDLNVMKPLIAWNLSESIRLAANASRLLADRCVSGIQANEQRCRDLIELSLAMVTPLALRIGYDQAAEVAYEAYRSGKTVREVLLARGILSVDEADEVLDPRKMV